MLGDHYERNLQENPVFGGDRNTIRDSMDRNSAGLLPNGRTTRYCVEIKIAPIESGISHTGANVKINDN